MGSNNLRVPSCCEVDPNPAGSVHLVSTNPNAQGRPTVRSVQIVQMKSKNGKIIVMADQSRSEHSAPKVYALVYAKVYANGKATRTSAHMKIKIDHICDNIKEVYRELPELSDCAGIKDTGKRRYSWALRLFRWDDVLAAEKWQEIIEPE
ncbi:hypothetical protein B0H17DRAFT_1143760 [Mycena rosella]|uniref:Uncharacterized protein n=1 Tax=Mycena rosella TaxID=1033263 RepID=A0AAD7CUZ5_MYCRO|nr:hypothetical protein B0H17DRAFT_1143760 [Mycena rosella]